MKTRVFTVCAFIFLFCGIVNAGINDGLVAYYPFNGNANDESGHGNNGTITPSDVTFVNDGKIGKCAKFIEGEHNKAIEIQDSPSLNITHAITMAAWVKLDGVGTDADAIICRGNSYSEPYSFFAVHGSYGNNMVAYIEEVSVFNSGYKVPLNMWKHVTVTYDQNNCIFYVDGVKIATIKTSNRLIKDSSGMNLYIGASPPGGSEDFSGFMDEVRIYNRALSDSEVQQLYSGVTTSVIVKPYTFTSGTPAKAAEVNEDFDVLYTRINALNAIVCQDHPTASICQ
jgi:hypothetical protein